MTLPDSDKLAALLAAYHPDDFTDLDFMVADLAREVLDLRAEVARMTADRDEARKDRLRMHRAVQRREAKAARDAEWMQGRIEVLKDNLERLAFGDKSRQAAARQARDDAHRAGMLAAAEIAEDWCPALTVYPGGDYPALAEAIAKAIRAAAGAP